MVYKYLHYGRILCDLNIDGTGDDAVLLQNQVFKSNHSVKLTQAHSGNHLKKPIRHTCLEAILRLSPRGTTYGIAATSSQGNGASYAYHIPNILQLSDVVSL